MARVNMPADYAERFGSKNWTKAELEEKRKTEVVMLGDNIKPSPDLPEHLHQKFYWLVSEFEEYGILANVDSDALSRYLMADYQYWEITKAIEKMDITDSDYSRITNVQNRFFTQAQTLAKDLGLTMVSRSKLVRQEREEKKEKTPEESLFGKALGL